MRPFLVCYDYGTGGLWWWIEAHSGEEIRAAYRDVVVHDDPPSWWSDDVDKHTPRMSLSDKPDKALALLAR